MLTISLVYYILLYPINFKLILLCSRVHMLNFWKFFLVCIHKNKDKKDT